MSLLSSKPSIQRPYSKCSPWPTRPSVAASGHTGLPEVPWGYQSSPPPAWHTAPHISSWPTPWLLSGLGPNVTFSMKTFPTNWRNSPSPGTPIFKTSSHYLFTYLPMVTPPVPWGCKIHEDRTAWFAAASPVPRTAGAQVILVEWLKIYTSIISPDSENSQDAGTHFSLLQMNNLRFRG